MKKLVSILTILISISCSEEDNNTPTAPVNDQFDSMEMQVNLSKQGNLSGVGHTVSGTVKVYNDGGKNVIVLDPFSTQNGPDLKIYLSTDQNASEYINLGALKSTSGKQSYQVPGMLDIDRYKFVLVWCQEFSVLFGKAELQ